VADLAARQILVGGAVHDSQLSVYPPGSSGFKKHVDTKSILAQGGRKISILLYLNARTWCTGGSLRLFPAVGSSVDVPPVGGRLVVFWSDMPHLVMPIDKGGGPRVAMTLWVEGSPLANHPALMAHPRAAAQAALPPVSAWWWGRVAAAVWRSHPAEKPLGRVRRGWLPRR
jgi:hypothetical protein